MTDFSGDSRPGFLFEDDTLGVDEDDPIYQSVVAAMKERGLEVPTPEGAGRPPEMIIDENGDLVVAPEPPTTPTIETPPVADGAQVPASGDPAAPSSPVPPPPAEETGEGPPVDPPAELPNTIGIEFGGQQYELNQDQVNYLLQINSWMESMPEETRQKWAGIEDGSMVAVSKEEYVRLTSTLPPAPAAPPPTPDLTYVDDDVKQYIERLQQSATPPAPTVDSPAPTVDAGPSPTDIAAAAQRQAERSIALRGEIATVTEEFATSYEMTPEQINRLQEVTVKLGVVPTLASQRAVYSPTTGQIISEAPMAEVMKQAYEIAMNTDPELKQLHDDRVFNERLAAQQQANQRTNEKKARAGSLASAPSAAVPANAGAELKIGPGNQMDFNATSTAIANALSEAMKNG
jgi:hypothetical protein